MLLRSVQFKSLLSFHDTKLELRPLNVIIGPNASGKSNLVAAIGLLRAAPGSLQEAIRRGGGIREWISKATGGHTRAEVACEMDLAQWPALRYSLTLAERSLRFYVEEEWLQDLAGIFIFDRQSSGIARLYAPADKTFREIPSLSESASFFAQYKDPGDGTPVTAVGEAFESIRIYSEFDAGPRSPLRAGGPVDVPKSLLEEDGSNLALVLQDLEFRSQRAWVSDHLKRFWDQAEGVRIRLEGAIAQVYVRERGIEDPISAYRLSAGTLKFLCLMAVLLHPEPPPLICIEEPELGLHPDAVTIVADGLREASGRCQVIVTTHSEALVSALSGEPEAVVVCERDEQGSTQFRRLRGGDLDEWLEGYTLGELWRKGEIGGNRW